MRHPKRSLAATGLLSALTLFASCAENPTELIGGSPEDSRTNGGTTSLGGDKAGDGDGDEPISSGTGGDSGVGKPETRCDSPGVCIEGRGIDVGLVSPDLTLYKDENGTIRFPSVIPDSIAGLSYASFDAYPDYGPDEGGYTDNKDSRTDEAIERLKSDAPGELLIALSVPDADSLGWMRVTSGKAPDFFLHNDGLAPDDPSLGYYLYTHSYDVADTWIELPPMDDSAKPPFVFGEADRLYFGNPLPIPLGVEIARAGLIANPSLTVIPGSFDGDEDGFADGDIDQDGVVDGDVYLADCSGVSQWKVWRSVDQGRTWERWSKPSMNINRQTIFWHQGSVYVMGWIKHPEDTADPTAKGIIYRSTDGGRSFSEGSLLPFDAGDAPSSVVIADGRIWKAVSGPDGNGDHGATLASAPIDADLMVPESWTVPLSISFLTMYNRQPSNDDLEGVTLLTREGRVANVVISDGSPRSVALAYANEPDEMEFNAETGIGALPQLGKLSIKYDPVTDKYWALSNTGQPRNVLSLFSSTDLEEFQFERDVLVGPSSRFHGFNYPDMVIEGDDIIFVSRTAWETDQGHSNRWHDANLFTFHRLVNFRSSP